ncbi:MAG: M48 family metalloprotease [Alphaproteobacteria bacterium]|nr:M48 family metalloprotease [Alphaproteobacteria bacterium]
MLARLGTGLTALVLAGALAGCTGLFDSPGDGVTRTGDGVTSISAGATPADLSASQIEHPKIIATYGGVYKDRDAEIALARLAGRLLAADNQGDVAFTVTILDTAEVNAFALPGGYIYVTRGLLTLANDTSELAAVVSHEIAHVTLRHAQARSSRARTGRIVDRVLGGILGANLDVDQSSARAKRSLAAFSQGQELDADREGIKIAARAGYDPHAAARFLAIMGRFSQFVEGEAATGFDNGDFLATHPSTPRRIETAVRAARAIGPPGVPGADRDRYLDAIDGIMFGNNPDDGVVIGQRFVHPRLKFTFTVPPGQKLTKGDIAVVAVASDGSAMRFDGAEVPPDMALADYLRSGWIDGLLPQTIRIGTANGLENAQVEAKTDDWYFRIGAIRYDDQVYRFIFAAEKDSPEFRKGFHATLESFQKSRRADISRIRRFSIDVVTASSGDTPRSLASRMRGVNRPEQLFLALNGLLPGDPIAPGQRYKVVKSQ